MTLHDELAGLAAKLRDSFVYDQMHYAPDPLLDEAATALQSLAAQLAEARDKALEEAAVAYEAETHTWTAWPEAGAARRKGAKAIRALKGSQQ